eukprot:5311628-Pyramimonas_sp.AAC.1
MLLASAGLRPRTRASARGSRPAGARPARNVSGRRSSTLRGRPPRPPRVSEPRGQGWTQCVGGDQRTRSEAASAPFAP